MARGAIAIEAAVPGAGKTYLVKSWVDRTGQKGNAIICCPWNALVTQLVKEGYRAITLHELVGRLVVETEDGRDFKKAYNLAGITHVHVEEAYLYPVHQVGWMADFIERHPGVTFSMAGDRNSPPCDKTCALIATPGMNKPLRRCSPAASACA